MAQNNSEEEFNELVTAFSQGRMTRRRFIHRASAAWIVSRSGEPNRTRLFCSG